jgi:exopolysaccharide production protein ExoZ
MSKGEIAALQYLRGLAATAVVIDHTNAMMEFPKYFGRNNGQFWNSGALGVNLFFIISGFIITLTSLRREENLLLPRLSLKTFTLKRFTRIVPIMWVAIATYYLGRALGRDGNFNFAYLRAFLLVPFGSVEPNNIWTLRHEAIFYILFAIAMLGPRVRPWILLFWIVSPLVYAALSLPDEPQVSTIQFARIVANPCNLEFASGMAIGLCWHRWTHCRTFSTGFSSGILIFGLFAFFWVSCNALGVDVGSVYSCLVSSLIGGLVIFVAIHLRCTDGPFERLLFYLGEASFSIYLFHLHFASASLGLWAKLFKSTPPPLVLIGTTLIALVGAVLIFEFVEKPVHRATFKILSKRFA